jgi:hypothetical protein
LGGWRFDPQRSRASGDDERLIKIVRAYVPSSLGGTFQHRHTSGFSGLYSRLCKSSEHLSSPQISQEFQVCTRHERHIVHRLQRLDRHLRYRKTAKSCAHPPETERFCSRRTFLPVTFRMGIGLTTACAKSMPKFDSTGTQTNLKSSNVSGGTWGWNSCASTSPRRPFASSSQSFQLLPLQQGKSSSPKPIGSQIPPKLVGWHDRISRFCLLVLAAAIMNRPAHSQGTCKERVMKPDVGRSYEHNEEFYYVFWQRTCRYASSLSEDPLLGNGDCLPC